MKKIAAVSIVAALLAAVLAVAAFKAGFFDSAEAERPAAGQSAAPKDIEKNVKVPVKAMRMHNVRIPSREQLNEAVRKIKEKKKKETASDKKGESCGE